MQRFVLRYDACGTHPGFLEDLTSGEGRQITSLCIVRDTFAADPRPELLLLMERQGNLDGSQRRHKSREPESKVFPANEVEVTPSGGDIRLQVRLKWSFRILRTG